jgi:hypothetical protein
MALTFSLVDTWEDGKRVHVSGTMTSGDMLDLSEVPVIASDQPPVQGTAWLKALGWVRYDAWTPYCRRLVLQPHKPSVY